MRERDTLQRRAKSARALAVSDHIGLCGWKIQQIGGRRRRCGRRRCASGGNDSWRLGPTGWPTNRATLERQPADPTHWSRASMAAETGLSRSTVGRIWRAFGVKPHVVDTFKISNEPQFMRRCAAPHPDLYLLAQPGRAVVRTADPQETPPRRTPVNSGPGEGYSRLVRHLERQPETLHFGPNRGRDPRTPQLVSSTNSWHRTLDRWRSSSPRVDQNARVDESLPHGRMPEYSLTVRYFRPQPAQTSTRTRPSSTFTAYTRQRRRSGSWIDRPVSRSNCHAWRGHCRTCPDIP